MNSIVSQHIDIGRKDFEFAGHDDVGEIVEDNVNLDALGSLARQVIFECLAHRIAFPDISFQVDRFLRGINGREHRVVKLAPVIKELDFVFTNIHLFQVMMGETTLGLMPLTPNRNSLENEHDYPLQPNY